MEQEVEITGDVTLYGVEGDLDCEALWADWNASDIHPESVNCDVGDWSSAHRISTTWPLASGLVLFSVFLHLL